MAIIQLGKGAYGNVYKCNDSAYKIILTDPLPGLVREIIVSNQLVHPCIVHCDEASLNGVPAFPELNFYDIRSHAVMKMKCADGVLVNYIKNNTLTEPQIRKIMLDILLGLKRMHEQSIFHLDVKPENILITAGDDNYQAQLCDFNLSAHCSWYIPPDVIGTNWYRAPEVTHSQLVGEPTDIWAWGCIIYELVTGTAIMNGSSTNSDTRLMQHMYTYHCFDPDVFKRRDFWLEKLKKKCRPNLEIDLERIAQLLAWSLDPNYYTRPTAKLILEHKFWLGMEEYIREVDSHNSPFQKKIPFNPGITSGYCPYLIRIMELNPLDDKYIIKTVSLTHDFVVRLDTKKIAMNVIFSYGLAYCIYNNMKDYKIFINLIEFAQQHHWIEPHLEKYKVYKDKLPLLGEGIKSKWKSDGIYSLHFADQVDFIGSQYSVSDWILWWQMIQIQTSSSFDPQKLMQFIVQNKVPPQTQSISTLAG